MKSVWAKDAKRRNHTTSIHKHTRKFKLSNYVKLEILRFDIWRTIIFVNLNENLDDWFRNSAQKKKKKNQKTENFKIQLCRCWGHNNITGQSNISGKDQDKPNRISDWASLHACSTLDQHFHWFLLSLKEAPNVSNKPPIQCNINQNNVTLVKQFKILNFPENREINNQFHLDFFTKQSPTCIMYIYIYIYIYEWY